MTTIFIPDSPHLPAGQHRDDGRSRHSRGAVILLSLIALTLCLGVWQLWRAYDKHRLLDEIARVQALPQLSWEQGVPPVWRHVQLQGRWLGQHEIWLDHRTQAGRVGYHIITPFLLKDGTILMVNRGWWPANEPAQPPAAKGMPQVVVQPWPRYIELGAAPVQGRVFQNLDPGRFAAWAYLPFPAAYVLARESAPGLSPLAAERPFGVERHLAYAVSWFLLAGIGSRLFRRYQQGGMGV
ncbi:SURF1 family protein [Chitinibacter sp. GC72]|uniref:SURF1 family protein n=1 Tax=Chitinibacter sp. GC72 TaxID=1526917 RepID=UPI0012FB1B61|nr:SURF1 family protein [Chitinibacter sp. GC72]